MKRILAVLLALLLAGAAWGATYYVDFAAGDDTNNGTATGTPWKHVPLDENATGVSGGTTLSSGDTIIFKRGVTYEGGGNAGAYVLTTNTTHLTFTVASDWGTGQAVLNCNGDFGFINVTKAGCAILGLSTSYELKFTGTSTVAAAVIIGGGDAINGGTVSYCEFSEIGTVATDQGIGIKIGDGSYAGEISNIVVSYNAFHGCESYGLKVSGGAGSSHDLNIHHNVLTNNGQSVGTHLEMNLSSNIGNGVYDCLVHDNTLTAGVNSVDGMEINNSPNSVYDNVIDGYVYGVRLHPGYNTNKYGVLQFYAPRGQRRAGPLPERSS